MSVNPKGAGAVPGISRTFDHDEAHGARRLYVAPRLGPGQSVRELTRAVEGSVGDGGGGGTGMMMMASGV
jgi:hypothetical protein